MAAVRTLDEQEVSLQIPVPPAASSSVITTAGRQPIRAEIVHAAKLAADAEENARERQHPKGKYTARERLDLLFDDKTFHEIGRFSGGNINKDIPGSAVVTGFGQIMGRTAGVYAQDFSIRGGTMGRAEGKKICHLLDMAMELKVPVIAVIDSGGARIQEGVEALTQYGRIFKKHARHQDTYLRYR